MVKTIKSFVAILALGQCLLALDGIECLALANQPTMRINASNRRRNRRRHMMQRRRRARRERQKNRSNRQISMQGININRKARSLPQPNTTLYTTTSSYNYNRPIITQPSSIPQMPIGTMTRIGDKIHRALCDNKFVPLTNVATSKQIKYAGLIIDDKKVTVTIDYNRIASEGISSPCVEIRNLDSNPIVFNLLHFATALTDESRISFLEVIQEDQKIDVSRKIRFTIDKLEYNVNPLYFAIYFNREDVVKKLLDIAKDKDQLDKICDLQETKILTTGLQEKYTILHRAILSESSDKITQHILDALEDKIGLLLNTKTDIKYDEFETSNCSPFLLAIFYGNVAIVNKLLTTAKTYKINSIWDACNHMIYKNEHLINPTPHQIAKFFNKNDIIELLNQAEKSSITSPQPPTSVPQPQHPSEHRPQPMTSVPPQITLTQVQLILNDIAVCLVLNSNHNCEYTLDETKKIAKFNNVIIKGQNATLDINYNDLVTKGLNSDCVILNGGYLTLRGLADYLYANAKQMLLNIIKNLEAQYSQPAKPAPHYPSSPTPAHHPATYQKPQGSAPMLTSEQIDFIEFVRETINVALGYKNAKETGNLYQTEYTKLLDNPFIIDYKEFVTNGLNSRCVILNDNRITLRELADKLHKYVGEYLKGAITQIDGYYEQLNKSKTPTVPASSPAPKPTQTPYNQPTAPNYPASPTPAHQPATYQKPQGSAPMLTSEQPQHPSEHRPQPPTSVPPQITLTQVQLILDDIALCLVLNSNHNCEYTLDETKKIAKFNNAIIKGQNATLDINYNDLVTKGLNSDCVILNGGYLTLRGLADYLYANAKQTLLNIIKNLETQYSQSAPKPPQPLYKQPTAPHYPPSYTPAHQPVKIVAPKPSAYQSPQAYHPGSAPVFTKSALLHQSSQPTLNKGQVELIGIVRGIINNILDGQITQEPGNPHKIKYTGLLANPFIIDYMELVTNGLNSRCVILNDNHLTLNELADKLYDRAVREELNQAITDLKPVFSQQQVTPNAPVARSNTLTQDDVKNITNTISGLLTNENRDCQVRKNTTSDIIEYTNIKIYDTYNHTDIKKTIYIDYSKLANEGLESPCVKINYNNSDKFFTILHLAAILKPSKVGINLLKTIKGHKTFNISAICPYKLVCTPDLDLTVLEFAIAIGNMDFARELLNIAKEQNKLHSILKASTGKFTTKSMGQLSKLIDIENSTILHRMIAHCRTDAIGVLLEAFKGDQNALKAMLLSKAVYKTSIEWSQDSGTYEVNDCTPLILAMNSENRDVAKAILDAAQTLDKPALSEIINSTCTFNLNVSGFVKITRCTPYILSIIPHFVNQKARIYMQNILTDIAKNNNIDILNATCDIDSYLVEMRNVTPLHILGHGNILSSKPGDNYEYAKMLLDKSKWLGKERIRNALLAKADYKYKKNDNSRNVIGVEDGTPLHFGATNKEFIRLITIHGCASNTINQNDILNDPCKNIIMRDGTTAQGITPYSIAILTTTDNEIHFLLNPNKN
ncbi:MAG: hypothetical protein LBB20_01835 [Puniceicoccales bacterium]|jgi:hypothetical protein|nr:hypothetical protein [Puniceicoccales bacterium]